MITLNNIKDYYNYNALNLVPGLATTSDLVKKRRRKRFIIQRVVIYERYNIITVITNK